MSRLSPMRPLWIVLPLGLLYLILGGRLVQLHAFPDPRIGGFVGVLEDSSLLPAARGEIHDRKGVVLAVDRPVYRLVLDCPWRFRRFHPDRRRDYAPDGATVEQEIARLAAAAGIDPRQLGAELLNPERSYKRLVEGLSPTRVAGLRAVMRDLRGSGLHLESGWERVQPMGRTLGHLIGLCMTTEQGQRVGRMGLEEFCDAQLHGESGYKQTQRVTGHYGINPARGFRMPKNGAAVTTTLDAALSVYVDQQLRDAYREHTPDWSAAVVLDARSGAILAMHGLPDYDPTGNSKVPDYKDSFFLPACNAFEPGSTFKPFVVAWALECGVIGPQEMFHSPGSSIYLSGRRIKNADRVSTEDMTAGEALVHSSNVVMVQIGQRLGIERMRELLDHFKFWDPVEILPCRFARGIKPGPDRWKGRQGTVWTLPSVSFGQQLMLNPVRLAVAYAGLLRAAPLPTPHLLAEEAETATAGPAMVSPSTAAYIRDHMRKMVERRAGRLLPEWDDLSWGGKSGTAQLAGNEDRNACTFVAVGPIDDPAVIVVVVHQNPVAENPSGTRISGPVAARILRRTLEVQGLVLPQGDALQPLDSAAAAAKLGSGGGE